MRLLKYILLVAVLLCSNIEQSWAQVFWPGSEGGTGGLNASSVIDASSNTTLTKCRNGAVHNGSAAGAVTVILCAAKKGMDVWVYLQTNTQDFTIDPAGSDRIRAPETDTDGDKLTWDCNPTACATGSAFHLISFSDGQWTVVEIKGSAPADGGA